VIVLPSLQGWLNRIVGQVVLVVFMCVLVSRLANHSRICRNHRRILANTKKNNFIRTSLFSLHPRRAFIYAVLRTIQKQKKN
jgi:hypothetical protein